MGIVAVSVDHDLKLIRGSMEGFYMPPPREIQTRKRYEKKFDRRPGVLIVRDIAGNKHSVVVPDKVRALQALLVLNSSALRETNKAKDIFAIEDEREQSRRFVEKFGRVERIFKVERNGSLWATVSDKYKPLVASDVATSIRSVFPDARITTEPETGKHGGRIHIDVGVIGPARFRLDVDMGHKNGLESARISGSARILACGNEFVLEPPQGRNRHSLRAQHEFADRLARVREQLDDFVALAECAKKTIVTKEECRAWLDAQVKMRTISNKARENVARFLRDPSIQQANGTLYGLAMCVTHAATHMERMKDGVKGNLRRLGGELFLVAPTYERYMESLRAKVFA